MLVWLGMVWVGLLCPKNLSGLCYRVHLSALVATESVMVSSDV